MLPTLVILVLFAPPVPPAVELPGDPFALEWEEPILLTKGKGFLIHVRSRKPKEPSPWNFPTQGMTLFHTATETGKMKALLATSTLRQSGFGFGAGSISYSTRLVGFASDTERLYLLVGSQPGLAVERRYHLAVYSLLHNLQLKEGDVSEQLPDETTKTGPLVVKENGVACYGVTFTFKGRELLEQRYGKK
jgi:hypothetical protein